MHVQCIPALYSSSLSNSIAFTFLARLLGMPGPLVLGCGALFSEHLNREFHVHDCQITHMMAVHVLAGSVETGLDSGPGGPCGRSDGVWSELSCLVFRDSRRVSESSVADGAGPAESLEGALFPPLSLLGAETWTGSERYQLRQHVGDRQ
jgi:hypothetical protein